MFGADRALDFLAVAYLHPGGDGKGQNGDATKALGYANRARDHHSTYGRYVETAYIGGLVFDILRMLIAAGPPGMTRKRQLDFLEETFEHGLATSDIALRLSKSAGDVPFTDYAFPACLVHDIGAAAMAVVHPEAIEDLKKLHSGDLPPGALALAEREIFGVTHAVYGGLVCRYFAPLRPVADVVLYHHDPYLFPHESTASLKPFTEMVTLANHVARHLVAPEDDADPVVQEWWKRPELEDAHVSDEALVATVEALLRKG
jgi:HD-like signal output (HDOD) protein